MANGFIKSENTQKVRVPPKRGRVKVWIFRSFVNAVREVFSKAVPVRSKRRNDGKVIADDHDGGLPSQAHHKKHTCS